MIDQDSPTLRDFARRRAELFLVRRISIVDANQNSVVVAVLYQGATDKAFVQAYSLDSWVVTGCHQKDVITKEQVKSLVELSPRFPNPDLDWAPLFEKAKTGMLIRQEGVLLCKP